MAVMVTAWPGRGGYNLEVADDLIGAESAYPQWGGRGGGGGHHGGHHGGGGGGRGMYFL